MRKRNFLALSGAAALCFAASPVLTNNTFAGITDTTKSHTTRIERHYNVDLTNGQEFSVPADIYEFYADAIYRSVNSGVGEAVSLSAGHQYCGTIVDGKWDDEAGSDFCFRYDGENDIKFYTTRRSDTVEIERNVVMESHTYFKGVTVTGNSDLVIVGDPNDIVDQNSVATFEYEERYFAFDSVSYGNGYAIIDGEDQEYIVNSEDGLTVHATGSFENDFDHVEVDDEELSEEDYEAKAGSTIVTLRANYLNSLSRGEHTLRIVYTDGEVETKFTIVEESPETADLPAGIFVMFACCLVLSIASSVYILGSKSRR